jgi:hypothetical protein
MHFRFRSVVLAVLKEQNERARGARGVHEPSDALDDRLKRTDIATKARKGAVVCTEVVLHVDNHERGVRRVNFLLECPQHDRLT